MNQTVTNIRYERVVIKESVRDYISHKELFTFDDLCQDLYSRGVSPRSTNFLLDYLYVLEEKGFLFYDVEKDLWLTNTS